jgi:hypothetical protein
MTCWWGGGTGPLYVCDDHAKTLGSKEICEGRTENQQFSWWNYLVNQFAVAARAVRPSFGFSGLFGARAERKRQRRHRASTNSFT